MAWLGLVFVCMAAPAAAFDAGGARWGSGEAGPAPHVLGCALLAVATVALAAWGVTLRRKLDARTKALRASEMRFGAWFDSLPDMAWIKDRDGRFLAANQLLAKACGAGNAEAMIGRTSHDFFPPDIADAHCHNDNLVLRRMAPLLVMEPYAAADGVVRRVKSSKAPFIDEAGRCTGTVGISRELLTPGLADTALGQAADVLRANEVRFRTVVDALPVGLLEIDRDGTITFGTDQAWSILGLSAHEGYDEPWINLIHADDLPAVIVALRLMRAKGDPLDMDVRLAEGRPSAGWVHMRAVPCKDTEGATVSILDVSATRRLEQRLREREEEFVLLAERVSAIFRCNNAGDDETRIRRALSASLYDGIRAAAGD